MDQCKKILHSGWCSSVYWQCLCAIGLSIVFSGSALFMGTVSLLAQDSVVVADLNSTDTGTLLVENRGQFAPAIRVQSVGAGPTVRFTTDGIWLTAVAASEADSAAVAASIAPATTAPATRDAIQLHLTYRNANPAPEVVPYGRVEASFNYFLGNDPNRWQQNVAAWTGVRYRDLYPGVDLEVTINKGRLTQTLVVREVISAAALETLLATIQLQIDGGDAVALGETMIQVTTPLGPLTLERPTLAADIARSQAEAITVVNGQGEPASSLFQDVAGERASVATATVPLQNGATLTETTLLYSTFLGGGDADQGYAMQTDEAGNIFVVGRVESTDFPATTGVITLQGDADIFVTKLNPGGNGVADLRYATLIGGADRDAAIDLVLDDDGQVTLVGTTRSTDFPTTTGAFQATAMGGSDGVVVTVGSAGNTLHYATYLGGANDDVPQAVARTNNGELALVGATASLNFPTTTGALQSVLAGGDPAFYDAFLVRLQGTNAGAAELTYGTYFGGTRKETALAVASDATGALYLAGKTDSGNFPTTPTAFDRSYNGVAELRYDDVFLTKLTFDEAGTGRLVYSSYLGGKDSDDARAIAVDDSGALYVTGLTISDNFPTTPGAFDRSYNGGTSGTGGDAYVAKVTPDGSRLEYATFYGGTWYELGHAIAVDDAGRAYIAGESNSADLPVPVTAFDPDYTPTLVRYYDAFLARFAADGAALTYATYLGDSGVDIAYGLVLGPENRVTLVGSTSSADFPTTVGAFDRGYNDGSFFSDPYDAFVTTLQLPPPPLATYRVAGRILDSNGLPAANVRVDVTGVEVPTGWARFTDSNGVYGVAELPAGSYTLTPMKDGFRFEPASRTLTVPPNGVAQDFTMFTAQSGELKPPLLVVHGFQGFSPTPISCTATPERYLGDPLRSTLMDLPDWFYADDDYEVYLARLDSGPLYTASIDGNALCLFQQIDALYDAAGRQPITIIAHSMGGLVSRACLGYEGCRSKVRALYTLGTPHGGLNYNFLLRLYLATNWEIAEQGLCLLQSPLCQFATDQMIFFNRYTPNQDGIRYVFIGGDENPLFPGALIYPTDGPNDGVVSAQSGIGHVPLLGQPLPANWLDSEPPVTQFLTAESHLAFIGNAYHENRLFDLGGTVEGRSKGYSCLRHLLVVQTDEPPADCRSPVALRSAADQPTLQTTMDLTGTLAVGETVTHTLAVDANAQAIFSLFWTTGTVALELISPSGLRVDAAAITEGVTSSSGEAISYRSTVTATDFLRTANYIVPNAEVGTWQLVVERSDNINGIARSQSKATNLNSNTTTRYVAFVTLESALQLTVQPAIQPLQPSTTAIFTATLIDASIPVTDATVLATLYLPDGATTVLTLTHSMSGTYETNYTVPKTGGGVVMSTVATGMRNDRAYSRQIESVWTIAPAAVTLAMGSADQLVDDDVDGRAEALLVTVPLSVSVPTTYTIRATLVTSDSRPIADVISVITPAVAGRYVAQLRFPGGAIGASETDGPYQVRNVVLIDPALGNVPVLTVPLLHTTAAYRYDDFVQPPRQSIYLPLVQR